MSSRPAVHIEDSVTDERLESIWQGISGRQDEYQPSGPPRRFALYQGIFAVAVGILVGWFFASPWGQANADEPTGPVIAAHFEEGAALSTGTDRMTVDLDDGSKITLAPRSRVAMKETPSDEVSLNLEEGRLTCKVAKDRGRIFSVVAGGVSVKVVGTEFLVERLPMRSGERVSVEVAEGVVEVTGPDGVHKRLSTGESWSVRVAYPSEEAPIADGESEPAELAATASRSTQPEGERDLFAAARAKRNAGDAAGAAQLYQKFLNEKSRDPRAGVAALELGRLRMDQLGDVSGAIAPLSQAARLAGGGLGDDALARLVRAHSQMGQVPACRSARSRYLKEYPAGVHADQVRAQCF